MVALPRLEEPQRRAAEVERAVLEAVAYSDVFDYPLTAGEICGVLTLAATRAEVCEALEGMASVEAVDLGGERFFALCGRADLAQVRLRRHEASGRLWLRARRYGRLIARLPYVRLVGVTGALAVDNSEAGDDIDYLIVTRPGRVWLTRAMTMAIVRLAALRGVTLCPNYLLAENALQLSERDFYQARELLQMVPLSGRATHLRMLAENGWWRDTLPNAKAERALPEAERRSVVSRVLEAFIPSRLADALDRWVFAHKGAELRSQAGPNPEAAFDRGRCKGHFEGHRRRTEAAVAERLARLEVSR